MLDANASVLRADSMLARSSPAARQVNQAARVFGLDQVDAAVAAATRQPTRTLQLRWAGSSRPSWPAKYWPGPACMHYEGSDPDGTLSSLLDKNRSVA